MKHSVAGIVRKNGLFSVAHRIPSGEMGSHWEFPGGKVENDEAFQESLIREYKEEFGITVKVGSLIGETTFVHKGIEVRLHAYEVIFPEGELQFVLSEHTEVKWVALKEIETLLFVDSDLLLLPYVSEWNKNN